MSRLSMTRWILATLAFLLLGWAVRQYGLNSARVILGAVLLMVYFFGGYGKKAPGAAEGAAPAPAKTESGPPEGSEFLP